MGTTWQAQWFDTAPASRFADPLHQALDTVVQQMSHWLPDSDLARLRSAPPGQPTPLPPEFAHVLAAALRIAHETEGAYSPTVAPLVAAWGFGPTPASQPPPDLHHLRERCDFRRLTLHGSTATHSGDLALDLSAIAKGFAVDQLARVFDRAGVANYLVEVGGELRAGGLKANGQPWWIEVEPPGDVPLPPIRLALSGWAVATSGDYRQRRSHAADTWSHTLDPRTGRPVTNGLVSVTVVHRECMEADAYSTALMVLGPQAGLDFADRHQIAALMIERRPTELVLHASRTLRAML